MVGRRNDTCYFCCFWIGQGLRERGPKGVCRRFPPVVTSRRPDGAFPVTLSTDWCGEWKREHGTTAATPESPAETAAAG